MNNETLYEKIGGEETIRKLVEAFYPRVIAHPLLKPIFPEDIRPVMQKQFLFLTQFTGGPPLYSQKHGHPMLRARHLPFPITLERANAWLECMHQAMDEIGLKGEAREDFWTRLVFAAQHMINQPSATDSADT